VGIQSLTVAKVNLNPSQSLPPQPRLLAMLVLEQMPVVNRAAEVVAVEAVATLVQLGRLRKSLTQRWLITSATTAQLRQRLVLPLMEQLSLLPMGMLWKTKFW
jgi:hypothetical protein